MTLTELQDRHVKMEAMRLLVTLLPPANRDTLWALLRFLHTVHTHAADTVSDSGEEVSHQ